MGLALRVVFPLGGPGAEILEKWGKLQSLPLRPPKLGKNYSIFGVIFLFFLPIFPVFGGETGEGNFAVVSPFFVNFCPRGFPGPILGGKTTRKSGKIGRASKTRTAVWKALSVDFRDSLGGPLRCDRRQCSCDTPVFRDNFQEATWSATPL